jgi:hypothetical protein
MLWHERAVLSSDRARRVVVLATRIPGPIVALVSLSIAAALLALPSRRSAPASAAFRASCRVVWPDFDWASVQRLFVPTVTIALLGAVESLLCARVADGMSARHRRHEPNQELMAQGIANIVTPFFGGIPATGTIARTVTNLRAGATSPVAGIVHALTLLAIVLVAAPLAADVPLAVLAGVLLFVAWNMGEWNAFRRMSAFSLEQRVKLFSTFLLTVLVDLTVAMEVGLAVACIVFVYRMGALFRVEPDDAHAASAPGVVGVPAVRVAVLRGGRQARSAARRAAARNDDARPRRAPARLDRRLGTRTPSRTCSGRWRAPASGWSSSASTSSRSRRCASGGSTPRSARRTCSPTATARSRRWSRRRRSRSPRGGDPGRLDSPFSPRLPPCPGSGSPTPPTSRRSSTR